jgi:hypothetical protein
MAQQEFTSGSEIGDAEGGASSLVQATKLVGRVDITPGWVVGLYPDAAEASGTFQYRARVRRERFVGPALDPERSAHEAARRACAMVRRYAVANRLDRLATLTYAGDGQFDERSFKRDMHAFGRRLRAALGGARYPYLYVPEWHPGGHGLHAHALFGQYVPQALLREAWGFGIADIRRRAHGIEAGSIASTRRAVGYISKYISKSFDAPRVKGLHRYELAQGFQPRVERIVGSSRRDALDQVSERMGREPTRLWVSDQSKDWKGPSALWVCWDD